MEMKRLPFVLVICLAAGGCAKGGTLDIESLRDVDPRGPVPEGYTRFVAQETTLAPGEEKILNEWLSAPMDADVDILDVRGETSDHLQRFLLYGTPDTQAVGTQQPSQDEDQVTLGLRFCGGIGEQSPGRLKLPAGVAFRLSKGRSLIANVHYKNPSAKPLTVRGFVDVKLSVPTPERQPAGRFISLETMISLPPDAESSLDVSCKLQSDIGLIAWANHMHALGVSIYTEVDRAAGGTEVLRNDGVWNSEWALDPHFSTFPPAKPFMLYAGDTIRTHCAWNNPGAESVPFPQEMCLGFGFFVGPKDVTCLAGKWLE
ncbi:Hypothetical protein A7982_08437 [Minicystis rosea]|nr:Hypothetical protein A7982_08437 [Minicystis rosea]